MTVAEKVVEQVATKGTAMGLRIAGLFATFMFMSHEAGKGSAFVNQLSTEEETRLDELTGQRQHRELTPDENRELKDLQDAKYPHGVPGYIKKSGKNEKHSNIKRRMSASENYEMWKAKVDSLRLVPNKTKETKKLFEKAKTQANHWKKKKDETGGHHGQKGKGNKK